MTAVSPPPGLPKNIGSPVILTSNMKKHELALLLAAAPLLWGCASFNHGDVLVERSTAKAMLEDTTITPFSEVKVSWSNYPYRSSTDSIGDDSVSSTKKVRAIPVPPEDLADLSRQARETFARAGLYDRVKGRGTLNLELTTFGRWTYRELLHSFLVDTGFIFIIPSSLRVDYYLAADFAVSSGTAKVETMAVNKTTFHLLLAPLYPFTAPGGRETSLLKQMLWRSATDIYARIKSGGQAAQAKEPPPPSPAPEGKTGPAPLSGPPLPPDRTWLPAEGGAAPAAPETPDKTWVVPTTPAKDAVQPEIKPASPDRNWETKPDTAAAVTQDD